VCSLARFDLANRGMRQSTQHTYARLLAFDETGAELGGFHCPPKILPGLPKFFRSLSESPTQTIDSSPCCKTGHSSAPPKWKCLAPPLRRDIGAAWLGSCKLLWRSEECVLLPCFNVQPDIFAVMNGCRSVEFIFLRYPNVERWYNLYSVQWRIKYGECV